MHNLLAETVAIPEAQEMDPRQSGGAQPGRARPGRRDPQLPRGAAKPRDLAETLIGGLSTEEFPETHGGEMLKLVRDAAGVTEYLLPPLPNTLYTRDTTCWIYGGVTLNPLFWPARHEETILTTAIYKFHPGLRRQGQRLVGRSDRGPRPGDARGRRRDADRQGQRADRHERAHLAPGASASSRRRCSRRARPSGSSSPRCPSCGRRCISTRSSPSPTATACCSIPTSSTTSTPTPTGRRTSRAASSCARTRSRSSRPWRDALGVKKMRVVETGGNAYMRERTQWDSGANLVCASPGVVFAYDRNTYTNTLLRKAGHRGHHHRRRRARPRPRRRPLHDLPDHPRSGRFLRP